MRDTTASPGREQTGVLETAGQRVRYRVRGEGRPLLMVHGLGAPLEFWRPLESRLGDFRTITLDPPGAGESSVPSGPFGMDRFAQVLEDLLTHLEVDSANVVGLSFGGMMAQELARRSPDRVEKLVLAATVCSRTTNPRGMAILADRARLSRFGREPVQDAGSPQEPSMLRLQWDLRGLRPSRRGFFVQSRAALAWSSRSWLGELGMPVLAIAGDDDPLVPVGQALAIASTVRNGRLELVPGGGHLWILKHPDAAARLIRGFLNEE